MTNANSITFDLAWYNILSNFSDSLRRKVFDAVLTFAATGQRPSFKGLAKLAFEFIAHEVSKQITTTGNPDSSESSGCSEELSENPEDSLVEQYYDLYKAPEPFRYTECSQPREITAERIHSLVSMTVKDMLDRGEIKPHNPEFLIHLNKVVQRRYEILCRLVRGLEYNEHLTEEHWAKFFNTVHWHNNV